MRPMVGDIVFADPEHEIERIQIAWRAAEPNGMEQHESATHCAHGNRQPPAGAASKVGTRANGEFVGQARIVVVPTL